MIYSTYWTRDGRTKTLGSILCCCLLLALIMMCAGRMDSSRWRFHSFIHSLRLASYSSVVISLLTPSMASWIINRCQHCCSCETGCTYNQSLSPPSSSVAITCLDEEEHGRPVHTTSGISSCRALSSYHPGWVLNIITDSRWWLWPLGTGLENPPAIVCTIVIITVLRVSLRLWISAEFRALSWP